jgi:DNA-binding response OmpR family regulator
MDREPYIIYIEDERPMIELVRETLKFSGYQLVGVTSGQQGLTLMQERKPDLLLLDLMMPDVSGWDVYRAMKADAELSHVPVIVITAKVLESGRKIADDLPPVDDYITKPFGPDRLIRSVQNLLPG